MSGSAATNTSATGGFISARAPFPANTEAVEDVLQKMISILGDIPGHLVRPRWQPIPPTMPPPETNWASLGVIRTEADAFPYIAHDGVTVLPGQTAPGVDRMQRHSSVYVMITFYGPEADDIAGAVRDGLYVQQNNEPLHEVGMKLYQIDDFTLAPELINNQYINRIDMQIVLRRQLDRVYPILNLDGADVTLIPEVVPPIEIQV
jgi:hypothetical protein